MRSTKVIMSRAALRIAAYRFRATFRRRWGGYLTLALLIGLVGGVAMGSLTAARRTYASYPEFLASTNPSDLLVLPSAERLRTLAWCTSSPGCRTCAARRRASSSPRRR